MNYQIIQGHALSVLKTLPAESVHCVVTSPPYWGLRDYKLPPIVWGGSSECEHKFGEEQEASGYEKRWHGEFSTDGNLNAKKINPHPSYGSFCSLCNAWKGSLGLEPTPGLYVEHLVEIFRELKRVLRKDGTLWLNMGDSYASSSTSDGVGGSYEFERPGWQPKRYRQSAASTGLKPKDLYGIPGDVVRALRADGWWWRSEQIWSKPNPLPESTDDRPTRSHEFLYLLAKNGAEAIYWTHPEKPGTRSRPEPDYVYRRATGEEVRDPPLNWEISVIDCPKCGGTGRVKITKPTQLALFEQKEVAEYRDCDRCIFVRPEDADEDEEDFIAVGKVREWRRVNLWKGHAYFYDQDAIREPFLESSIERIEQTLDHQHGGDKEQGYLEQNIIPGGGDRKRHSEILKRLKKSVQKGSVGRNKRTVWSIPTQPYKGAHFSTFPEALVEPCVKAGTSAKGCCPTCQAPWERVVERDKREMRREVAHQPGNTTTKVDSTGWTDGNPRTIGWQPTCSHPHIEADTVPCLVMDIFAGSGTVGVVALKHGRKFMGIELNPEYVEMAHKRIHAVAPLLMGGE